jgi:hypothetical protein
MTESMSVRENEQQRSHRALRKSQKEQCRKKRREQRQHQIPLLLQDNDNRILIFREWCALNGISERTGRRLLASGDGPLVTQLSPRRIGISIANNRAWQARRARGGQEE